ncbi:MAG: hypothetical protein ER33_13345 [Cyanobium sp. CACIAM 14]|nr:MAG: hypothetical protein ER33_13345 [Cyanobium sp. CACIAM 14]
MSGSLLRRPGSRWLWMGQPQPFGSVPFWFGAVTWLMLQSPGLTGQGSQRVEPGSTLGRICSPDR